MLAIKRDYNYNYIYIYIYRPQLQLHIRVCECVQHFIAYFYGATNRLLCAFTAIHTLTHTAAGSLNVFEFKLIIKKLFFSAGPRHC